MPDKHYLSGGNGPSLVACTVVPFILTWAVSAVRIYVRRVVLKIWKVEDWLFIASQILFSGLTICAFIATIYGNGQHLKTVSIKDLPVVMKYWYTSELTYIITSLLIRLSIGFFLLRICAARAHVWIIRCTMAIMTLVSIVYFGFMVFQCMPIAHFWTRFTGGPGKCFGTSVIADVTIGFSAFAGAVDLIFGILPVFMIWDLKMNPKTKIIVGGLLTMGIFAGLSVIIRIYYINMVRDAEQDFTFLTFRVAVWSIIEPAIGIICMAIATYRPLFKSLTEKISQASHPPHDQGTGYATDGTPLSTINFSRKPSTIQKQAPQLTLSMHKKNWRRSGYTRTMDGSKSDIKFEDSLRFEDVLEKDEVQRQNSVTGGRKERIDTWDFMVKEGIMIRSTVEIVRTPKREGDFV